MNHEVSALTKSFGVVVAAAERETVANIDLDEVIKLYQKDGAVILRGFNIGRQDFVLFTNRILSPVQHPLRVPYDNDKVFREQIVYDEDPTRSGRPRWLHAEASDTGVELDMCCFLCETPAFTGGETTLGDGIEILGNLPQETRDAFAGKQVAYAFEFSEEEWHSFFRTSSRTEVEGILAQFTSLRWQFYKTGGLQVVHAGRAIASTRYGERSAFVNAIPEYLRAMDEETGAPGGGIQRRHPLMTFEDGSPLTDAIARDVVTVCNSCEYPLHWNVGDLAIIDNSRILQGRRAWPTQYNRVVHARFGTPLF